MITIKLKYINKYNNLRQQCFSKIADIDLYLEIEYLIARDQFVRSTENDLNGVSDKDWQDAAEKYINAIKQNDTIQAKKYREILFPDINETQINTTNELMYKVESLNIVRLTEITKEHGWQNQALILLWHQ